ncbi:MAG: tRNA-specific adenosine deaminase [Actinomycetia bacterium]|nr:tRNA-specific adenosine deaminase [Actinomycetes bacterium]
MIRVGDEAHLRTAIEIAARARANGNHPFGSLLTDPSGTKVLEAENTVVTGDDVTGHAETNLVRLSGRLHTDLSGYTLYASTEPCAMCAGAIYWAGIGRVVYALAETQLLELTRSHPGNPGLALSCEEVFARGQRQISVSGPHFYDEAAAVHAGFWTEQR